MVSNPVPAFEPAAVALNPELNDDTNHQKIFVYILDAPIKVSLVLVSGGPKTLAKGIIAGLHL